ncbi:MAG: hypothetical protein ND895_07810 [Pyrinomonadaceae bacterium]|nr:hypothetical protein [Pyrinomonadaceae bacterium]
MDFLKQTRTIERLQFFNGQRLFAEDLQGLDAFNREMRWLHNISLHQVGIGNGFAVVGKRGDREVRIGPGYAIDGLGREIVSITDHVEPVQPVAGEDGGTPTLFDLTISYGEELEEAEQREGICKQQGTIRLKEEPVFCWIELDADGQPKDQDIAKEILSGMRIVLARAEVLNCQLEKDISVAQRLNARVATQPYICCGTSTPIWRPLILAPLDPGAIGRDPVLSQISEVLTFLPIIFPIGLTAVIDTRECGFRTTPCYSARIAGTRVRHVPVPSPLNEGDTMPSITPTIDLAFIIDGFVQIVDPQPNQFTINVLLIGQLLVPDQSRRRATANLLNTLIPSINQKNVDQQSQRAIDSLFKYSKDPDTKEEKGWHVVWMGVED